MTKKLNITNEQSFISLIQTLNKDKVTSKQKNILRNIGDDAAVFQIFLKQAFLLLTLWLTAFISIQIILSGLI